MIKYLSAVTGTAMVDYSSLVTTILVFITFLLACRLALQWRENQRGQLSLPGPLANWIPIVGALPLLANKEPHMVLCHLAEKYGKIFKLQLGSTTMVVITDHKLFREIFKRSDITYRRLPPSLDVMDGLGIVHANGDMWKTQRYFVQTVLRNLGMFRTGVRSKVLYEERAILAVSKFLDEVANKQGECFDIDMPLSFTILKLFLSTVTSTKFESGDPDLTAQIQSSHETFRIQKILTAANFVPWLRYSQAFKTSMAIVMKRREECRNFFRKIISERKQFGRTVDIDGQVKSPDLIDAFLSQMEQDKRVGKTPTYFTELQLLSILGDLSSAGLETTKTTIQWLLLALLHKPDVQAKIHEELDSINFGDANGPSLDDRSRLPYVEATIQETLRFSSILPVGLGRNSRVDTTIDGYQIPREAIITGLLWKFHHDPDYWLNPDDFDPNNHLDEDGRVIRRCDYLMPFSTGRRICLGEDIARNQIFLLVTGLLNRFRFEPAIDQGDNQLPSLHESVTGILRSPLPFKIRAIQRSSSRFS